MNNSTKLLTTFLVLSLAAPNVFARMFHWRSRTRNSGSCDRKITQAGRIRLTGATQPSFYKFPPYCVLKILSGANEKIKLTFQNPTAYQCSQKSFVAVLDGWLISDGLRRSQTFIPESRDVGRKRQKLVCVDDGVVSPRVVQSSSNLAEVAYRLDRGHEIDVLVEFVPENQSCDVVLADSDAGKEFVMDTKGEAGVCRWYLPGGAVINIHEFSLVAHETDDNTDVKCPGNRLLLKSGDSYRKLLTYKTVCTPQDIAGPIRSYCKQTVLELHSIDSDIRQFVKFSFRFSTNMYQALAVCSK